VFGGFYTGKTGTGTQIIDATGAIVSGKTTFTTSNTTLYAKWTQCSCSNGTGATGCTATVSNNKCNYSWSCSDGAYAATKSANAQGTSYTATCNLCSALASGYTHSNGSRNAASTCYLTTTAGKYVKVANNNQVTCDAGGYCPGSVTVQYGSTGGRTPCPNGYTNNTQDGKDDITDCEMNCPAGTWTGEYQKLEYIEATGTQYIDTGHPITSTTFSAEPEFSSGQYIT
jgi:hypothetical protein